LADLLRRHQQSGLTQYADLDVSDSVDSLIILDRSVDWVTPMCTQLTYEGMIDEFVGIKNCKWIGLSLKFTNSLSKRRNRSRTLGSHTGALGILANRTQETQTSPNRF
jgi:hypothetical protein